MLRTYTCIKGAVVFGLIAALTPSLWAQPLQQQRQTVTPSGGAAALPTAPVQNGLIWFTNQDDFEAFNASAGKVLKGVEDFEESLLDRDAIDIFDDSLVSGMANLPDGFPFPFGMTGLPNLTVQSNVLAGDPFIPLPRGANGLVAVSDGFFGAVSDFVFANIPGDSLDLIFNDQKSGVGFNTLGGDGSSVEVRVYSTDNVYLGMTTTPADISGTNFMGMWSSIPIGRINIFNPSDAGEGADNIQAWEVDPAGLIWFTNQADFEAFNAGEGKVLKGIENFEESTLDPNAVDTFDDPLESDVPNSPDGFPFPVGMTGLPNLIVQSNVGGGDPTVPDPTGSDGLAAVSAGAGGAVSDVVVARNAQVSLDLIFTDQKSGVGFNTVTFLGGTSVEVRVYSPTNLLLGMMTTPADPTGANFIGVWSPIPIGRINIFDPSKAAEGADNIQAWEAPPPGGLIWFNDQGDFETFNSGDGKVRKGTEDFEESILNNPQGFLFFDDPLESGVPNSPNGFPFPDGMTGLPNLILQSNILGGHPTAPKPEGLSGLMAVSTAFGMGSDVVLTSFLKDFGLHSLDLIFTEEKSGVGFNTKTKGSESVEVRVYSSTNVFLGMMTSPADNTGANFIGVWSPIPIGRINIFDPSNGIEGADNIQAWEVGSVDFFLDADQFELALSKRDKELKGFEDFSENVLGPNEIDFIDDPLDANTSDPESFPKGILIDNLTFQSNVGGADSSEPNPHGADGLVLLTIGFLGVTADTVLASVAADAFDILSGPPDGEPGEQHTALGLNLITFGPSGNVTVTVYDENNNFLGSIEDVPAPVADGGFLGMMVPQGLKIGRVNIWNPDGLAEGVYDVAAYFVDLTLPCPWDLDRNGLVGATDLLSLLVSWGPCNGCPADFDDDGFVGVLDLIPLLEHWGFCPL